jgi:hypothetical protein
MSNLRRMQTRAEAGKSEHDCTCCVCTRARLNGNAMKTFRKDLKAKNRLNKENVHPGLLRLCPDCFTPISQGCCHDCGAQAEFGNVVSIFGPQKMEQLCHSFMKERASHSGDNITSLKGRFGGIPMKVTINPKPEQPKQVFGLQHAVALRTEGNLTSK